MKREICGYVVGCQPMSLGELSERNIGSNSRAVARGAERVPVDNLDLILS